MAITSAGYDGSVDEVQWAGLAAFLGTPYAVANSGDWAVTTVAGADRTVRVAVGVGYGHGVRDASSTTVDLQLPTIASGTRWDLIAARRNWQPAAGTTTFVVVTGTSAQAIPAGRLVNAGVQDDQLLALVQVTAGQTVPTAVIDLRAQTSKVLTVASLLALPNAPLGTVARVAGRDYYREPNGAGTLEWLSSDVAPTWECGGSLGQSIPNEVATGMRVGTFQEATGLTSNSASGAAAAVTIATGGRYSVSMATRLVGGGAVGQRGCFITINRPGLADELRIPGSTFEGPRPGDVAASGNLRLVSGDLVRPFVYQNSGGNLAISDLPGTISTLFCGTMISR